jgi:hypothetical protein
MAQVLDLPINVPWTLLGASEDMMDNEGCDRQFPLEWRTSLALSAFEPNPEDLPEGLCDTTITFLKVTCTITGLQASRDETKRGHDAFSKVGDLSAILDKVYLACYGTLVNVAVTPSPVTRTQLDSAFTSFGGLEPSDTHPNPLSIDDVSFRAVNRDQNQVLDLSLDDGTQPRVLDLQREMEVTVPATPRVTARLIHRQAEVTMDAFRGTQLVGSQRAGPAGEQVDVLQVDGEGIDRVVLRASDDKAFLLELVHAFEVEVPIGIEDFPRIIDFEPKMRDLYQGATEDGEVLTASTSEIKTDKSHTRTDSSETGLSILGAVGAGLATAAGALAGGVGGAAVGATLGSTLAASQTHKWGDTNQDNQQVQTDASRDRRERYATTTNISQMYNLLTGYHLGTNRAVFLMLPRPHVLQPTDFRTFVQGLRYIEGVQEFFLVVARPSDVPGLCVNATLETGHFSEDVKFTFPDEQFKLDSELFIVTAESKDDEARSIEEFPSSKYTVRDGMVIDRSGTPRNGQPAGDPFHNGIQFLGGQDDDGLLLPPQSPEDPRPFPDRIEDFNYQPASDATVQVMGRVLDRGDSNVRHVALRFKVFTRSQQPVPSTARPKVDTSRLVIAGRRLCVCFQSGDCPKVTDVTSESPEQLIIDEQTIQLNPDLLTLTATTTSRQPAMKELQRGIQVAMAGSGRLPSRRPLGEVGFLESDFFTESIKTKLPSDVLQLELGRVRDLPDVVVRTFGAPATVADALRPDLAEFVARTGLSFKEAGQARFTLLTAQPKPLPPVG